MTPFLLERMRARAHVRVRKCCHCCHAVIGRHGSHHRPRMSRFDFQPRFVRMATMRRRSAVPMRSVLNSSAPLATWMSVTLASVVVPSQSRMASVVPRGLLRRDDLALEGFVGPPRVALAIAGHGLGEKLITIPLQALELDAPALHRPEAAAAGFVAKVAVLVGRADENALP